MLLSGEEAKGLQKQSHLGLGQLLPSGTNLYSCIACHGRGGGVGLLGMALMPWAMTADGVWRHPESGYCHHSRSKGSWNTPHTTQQHMCLEMTQTLFLLLFSPLAIKWTTDFYRNMWVHAARHWGKFHMSLSELHQCVPVIIFFQRRSARGYPPQPTPCISVHFLPHLIDVSQMICTFTVTKPSYTLQWLYIRFYIIMPEAYELASRSSCSNGVCFQFPYKIVDCMESVLRMC